VMNFRGNRISVVSVEATMMQIAGVLDARLTPDFRGEDAQCSLRVVALEDADQGALRREIIRLVTPKGLIREISFVQTLEKTRSGKAIRRDQPVTAAGVTAASVTTAGLNGDGG